MTVIERLFPGHAVFLDIPVLAFQPFGEIGAGDDGLHTLHRQRLAGVDLDDLGMGMGAAQDGGMQRSRRRRPVIKELAAPGQKRGVFHPQHRLIQPVLWHASSPPKPSSGVEGH